MPEPCIGILIHDLAHQYLQIFFIECNINYFWRSQVAREGVIVELRFSSPLVQVKDCVDNDLHLVLGRFAFAVSSLDHLGVAFRRELEVVVLQGRLVEKSPTVSQREPDVAHRALHIGVHSIDIKGGNAQRPRVVQQPPLFCAEMFVDNTYICRKRAFINWIHFDDKQISKCSQARCFIRSLTKLLLNVSWPVINLYLRLM